MQDLLNHEFFVDNIKIEQIPAPEPSEKQSATPTPVLTMRMDVPKQDTTKKNGQQSVIEFTYHMEEDVPEDVVSEMVSSSFCSSSILSLVQYLIALKLFCLRVCNFCLLWFLHRCQFQNIRSREVHAMYILFNLSDTIILFVIMKSFSPVSALTIVSVKGV